MLNSESDQDKGLSIPTDRRAMLAGLGGLAAGALLSSGRSAHAGPLNPPAGPIEPTMKRLDEIEARIPINSTTAPGITNAVHRILLPGSYYLTGDIIGESGKSGLQVIAVIGGEVVIDLNGFAIRGVNGSFNGITCNSANPRLVIRNGQIRDWGAKGISANCRMLLEDLRVEDNAEVGATGGDTLSSQVRRCVFAGNGGDGLTVGEGSMVEQCTARGNTGIGFSTHARCTVAWNHALNNEGGGIRSTFDCSISNCLAHGNDEFGIDVIQRCTVTHCNASANTGSNIQAAEQCVVQSNTVSGAITVGGKEGLGIVVTASGNRVEGNTCLDNAYGLRAVNSGNLIIRNMFQGNNFAIDIAAFNALGPVVGALTNGTTETGNGGYFGDIGSFDPNANFVY